MKLPHIGEQEKGTPPDLSAQTSAATIQNIGYIIPQNLEIIHFIGLKKSKFIEKFLQKW
ncbi:MAG: hypothetical protein IJD43_06590 [Thermoguttaceae bacterium]|nr:hypothetical protein [Thermoguttaceae bacterium]